MLYGLEDKGRLKVMKKRDGGDEKRSLMDALP